MIHIEIGMTGNGFVESSYCELRQFVVIGKDEDEGLLTEHVERTFDMEGKGCSPEIRGKSLTAYIERILEFCDDAGQVFSGSIIRDIDPETPV